MQEDDGPRGQAGAERAAISVRLLTERGQMVLSGLQESEETPEQTNIAGLSGTKSEGGA